MWHPPPPGALTCNQAASSRPHVQQPVQPGKCVGVERQSGGCGRQGLFGGVWLPPARMVLRAAAHPCSHAPPHCSSPARLLPPAADRSNIDESGSSSATAPLFAGADCTYFQAPSDPYLPVTGGQADLGAWASALASNEFGWPSSEGGDEGAGSRCRLAGWLWRRQDGNCGCRPRGYQLQTQPPPPPPAQTSPSCPSPGSSSLPACGPASSPTRSAWQRGRRLCGTSTSAPPAATCSATMRRPLCPPAPTRRPSSALPPGVRAASRWPAAMPGLQPAPALVYGQWRPSVTFATPSPLYPAVCSLPELLRPAAPGPRLHQQRRRLHRLQPDRLRLHRWLDGPHLQRAGLIGMLGCRPLSATNALPPP